MRAIPAFLLLLAAPLAAGPAGIAVEEGRRHPDVRLRTLDGGEVFPGRPHATPTLLFHFASW